MLPIPTSNHLPVIDADEVYRASVQLMSALIQSGEMKAYSDRNRESYNRYCVEKAISLYKDVKLCQQQQN